MVSAVSLSVKILLPSRYLILNPSSKILTGARLNGSGKTTQCGLLERWLIGKNIPTKTVKPLEDEMRERFSDLVIQNSLMANIFLFCMFYRKQTERIKELLEEGYVVLTDRYSESFLLFHKQYGLLKRAESDHVYKGIEAMVFEGVEPDITFYLQVDMSTANERIRLRNRSDINFETEETCRFSIDLFQEIARTRRCVTIDGLQNPMCVHTQIRATLNV